VTVAQTLKGGRKGSTAYVRQTGPKTLVIPLPLPHLNQIIAGAKRHWSGYARNKRRATERVMLLAFAARLQPIATPVTVTFSWHPPDRRVDPDNQAAGGQKVILDGLVAAGVLPDDSLTWVRGIQHFFAAPDPDNPRVEVTWHPS
jgi:hypothetical protein